MTGLSAVLGNDPVILSGTAFLVYFTKVAEVSPVAWLFSEFASCNTASMLLFVGMRYYWPSDNRQSDKRRALRGLQSQLSCIHGLHSLPLPSVFSGRFHGVIHSI